MQKKDAGLAVLVLVVGLVVALINPRFVSASEPCQYREPDRSLRDILDRLRPS